MWSSKTTVKTIEQRVFSKCFSSTTSSNRRECYVDLLVGELEGRFVGFGLSRLREKLTHLLCVRKQMLFRELFFQF
jgi:hypothetical protein